MKAINRLLMGAGVMSILSFSGCAILVAKYLVCNNVCPFYLILSTIILASTFIMLLVLLWFKKEMQPEEIRRDMRILELIKEGKKSTSNAKLFENFEAVKKAISEMNSTIEHIDKRL